MHASIGGGNRDEWEFEYTANNVADGAQKQKDWRKSRVNWWTNQKDAVMAKIRESGLQVVESVAEQAYGGAQISAMSAMRGGAEPRLKVDSKLERDLNECWAKIKYHMAAVEEYDGWVQVLRANPENRVRLTHSDWLYFFAAHPEGETE